MFSDIEPQVKATNYNNTQSSTEVFFYVNVNELFGINLDYPGIIGILNNAFNSSKAYIPVDTGLTKKSYTIKRISQDTIKVFFDRNKIIGANRNGSEVKEYYVQYIAEHSSRFNWLAIVMKHFYDALYSGIRKLKDDNINMAPAGTFLALFNQVYEAKKQEYKELRKQDKEFHKLKLEEIKRLKRIKNQVLDEEAINGRN